MVQEQGEMSLLDEELLANVLSEHADWVEELLVNYLVSSYSDIFSTSIKGPEFCHLYFNCPTALARSVWAFSFQYSILSRRRCAGGTAGP